MKKVSFRILVVLNGTFLRLKLLILLLKQGRHLGSHFGIEIISQRTLRGLLLFLLVLDRLSEVVNYGLLPNLNRIDG